MLYGYDVNGLCQKKLGDGKHWGLDMWILARVFASREDTRLFVRCI
jgi:hypothetical protein